MRTMRVLAMMGVLAVAAAVSPAAAALGMSRGGPARRDKGTSSAAPRQTTSGLAGSAPGAAGAPPPPPQDHTTWGAEYNLLYQLLMAIRQQNYTGAQSLLAPDGYFWVSSMSCDAVTPAQIVSSLQADPVTARWYEIGAWTGNVAGAMFSLQAGAVLSAAAGDFANTTTYDPALYVFASATADGTKLQQLSVATNTAGRQSNATAMMRVYERIHAAWLVGDVATYDALLAPGFSDEDFPAWNQYPYQQVNRSAALASLQREFAIYPVRQSFERAVFVSCNLVIADTVLSVGTGAGQAAMQRRVLALQIGPDLTQATFAERFLMTISV